MTAKTKAKPSPGPWTYEHTWAGLALIRDANGKLIGTLEKHAVSIPGHAATEHSETQDANARLIVAGPALLRGLRAAWQTHSEKWWQENAPEAHGFILAAIAKAEPDAEPEYKCGNCGLVVTDDEAEDDCTQCGAHDQWHEVKPDNRQG